MKDEETPIPKELLQGIDCPVPNDLERKVVSALKAQGLIGSQTLFGQVWKYAAAAVLLIGVFGLGFWAKGRTERAQSSTGQQRTYALFLYEPAGQFQADSGHVQEYIAWITAVRSSGRVASGEKLKDGGSTLQLRDGKLQIEEGDPSALGGYFLIHASNYEEALKIASGCPHLKHGGVIALREIDHT